MISSNGDDDGEKRTNDYILIKALKCFGVRYLHINEFVEIISVHEALRFSTIISKWIIESCVSKTTRCEN